VHVCVCVCVCVCVRNDVRLFDKRTHLLQSIMFLCKDMCVHMHRLMAAHICMYTRTCV
jgi:hypothetical protein